MQLLGFNLNTDSGTSSIVKDNKKTEGERSSLLSKNLNRANLLKKASSTKDSESPQLPKNFKTKLPEIKK